MRGQTLLTWYGMPSSSKSTEYESEVITRFSASDRRRGSAIHRFNSSSSEEGSTLEALGIEKRAAVCLSFSKMPAGAGAASTCFGFQSL